jgi:hypothetical protein
MTRYLLNNKLGRMWKEVAKDSWSYLLGICVEDQKKTTKISARTAGIQVDMRRERLLKTNEKHYCFIRLRD